MDTWTSNTCLVPKVQDIWVATNCGGC